MDCAHFLKKMYLYESGELSREDLSDFENHRAGCATCQQEFAFYQALVQHYHSLPAVARSRVQPKVLMQHAKEKRGVRAYFQAHRRMFVPAFAAVALACLIIPYFWHAPGNNPASQPQGFVTLFDQPSLFKTFKTGRRKHIYVALPPLHVKESQKFDSLAAEITDLSIPRQSLRAPESPQNQLTQLRQKIRGLSHLDL